MSLHQPTGARRVIEHLGLEAHPEGGWYRRTWSSPDSTTGNRGSGSSILYLLESGPASRWHRIDASELWQHVAGAPMVLRWHPDGGPTGRATLGPDLLDGGVPQVVVQPGVWQSARSTGAWSLVTCVVVPEFRFDGFELAPEGWEPPVGDEHHRGDPRSCGHVQE